MVWLVFSGYGGGGGGYGQSYGGAGGGYDGYDYSKLNWVHSSSCHLIGWFYTVLIQTFIIFQQAVRPVAGEATVAMAMAGVVTGEVTVVVSARATAVATEAVQWKEETMATEALVPMEVRYQCPFRKRNVVMIW